MIRLDSFVVKGGRRLSGDVRISGSKNAALPVCLPRFSRTTNACWKTFRICRTFGPRFGCWNDWVKRSLFGRAG
jgi:hypothetical protein